MSDDNPLDDDSDLNPIFMSADGINLSAPWRLHEDGYCGALTPDQIADLATRFNLDPGIVLDLSRALGDVLNPIVTANRIQIDRSVAEERGEKEVLKALRAVATAKEQLEVQFYELKRLKVDPPGRGKARAQFRRSRRTLHDSLILLQQVQDGLEQTLASPGTVRLETLTDKRTVRDERRTLVLSQIFIVWDEAGRSLTFTTDPQTSERRGPLIDFVNAVVACVTDPASTLSGETIGKEMKAFRRLHSETASVSIDSEKDD